MDIRPIAASERNLSGRDYFLLWAGVAISLAEILAGGFLAPMGVAAALLAILLGHLIGNTLMALGSLIGSDHGIPSMVSVRPAFGMRGSNFAALLNVVQLVCWASIMLIIAGRAGAMLGESAGGLWASSAFWIVLVGAGTLLWALFTGTSLWKVMQGVSVLGLVAILAVLSVQSFRGFSAGSPGSDATDSLPFMMGVDLVIAMPISWLPLVADYSRYARNGTSAAWNTWLGYFLVSSWMFLLGLMATIVTGTAEPHIHMLALMGDTGLAVLALFMVVLSTITSDFPDLYSATCSMRNVTEKVPPKAFLWGTGIVSILVALVFPMDRYESFLYFIGAMFVPLFGVVLTDYFVVRRRELDTGALFDERGAYWYAHGYNPRALLAWALGFSAYKLIEIGHVPVGASLPSFFLSGLVYYLVQRDRIPSEEPDSETG